MRYRNLLLAAVLAGGLAGAATVAVDDGIAVKESDVATPARGMTMEQVATKFGTPVTIRLSKWAVARCLRSLKMYQAASDILQELLKFPEAGYASEELGEDLLALGRADEAKPYFKKAFELLSQDLELRDHDATRLKRLHDLSQ